MSQEHELGSAAENSELSPDERAELERLRAERAKLGGQGAGPTGTTRRRRFSWRTPVSIVLIVLGCILGPVAVLGVWAGNEVSDTGRWVATVEPLIHDPAIQNVLTDKITTEITSRLNLTGTINQASAQLNDRGLTRISSLLTTFGPQIASAVTGFIHSTVHTVITSPAAAKIWVQVNTTAHQAVVKVLSGQGNGAISTSNGQITLSLGPFIAVVKQDLIEHGFSLASNIPPVSPTVALFQAKDLGKAQAGYRLIKTLKIVLPILALALLAAGVYVARKRRRALIGATLGLAASMLVLAIGLLIARSIYLNSVPPSVLPGRRRRRRVRRDGLLHQGGPPGRAGGRAGHRHRGVHHRTLARGHPDPFGPEVGSGLGPELRRTPGSVHRPGRRVDVRAPQGPPDRGGGPHRPDLRLLGSPHPARRHPARRHPAAAPRADRADRPPPGETRGRRADLTDISPP